MLSNTGGVSGAELAVPPLSRLRTSAAASKCRSPISAQVLLARPPRSFSHRTQLKLCPQLPAFKNTYFALPGTWREDSLRGR